MQDEPRNSSFATPTRRDASITLLAIARLSYRKSPGRVSLAWIPPARAAASSTAPGRCSSNQRLTVACSRRSTASRLTVNSRHSSRTKRRINAEPTIPRWPATNTRSPFSGKSVGCSMFSIASRYGDASSRAGKPSLIRCPLTAREIDVVPDHHFDQLWEGNPRVPAENATSLCRIAAQRIDLCRPEISAIYFDMALPLESGRFEGKFHEIAHAVRLSGGDDVVVGLVLQTLDDSTYCPGYLACNESLAPARALMIE